MGLDAGLVVGDAAEEGHGALAGEEVVVDHAADADHGKPAVLDLLELHSHEVLLAQTQGIEHEVAGSPGAAVHGLVDGGEGAELKEANPEEDLCHGGGLVASCRICRRASAHAPQIYREPCMHMPLPQAHLRPFVHTPVS